MDITLKQFCQQWLRLGTSARMGDFLERQVMFFAHQAALISKTRFQQSFEQGGFYGSGERWPERTSRWGRRFHHPVMNHSGLLKSSIHESGTSDFSEKKPAPGQKSHYSKKTVQTITANAVSEPWPGRRGVRKNDVPTTYAAVHNAPPSFGFWTNQHKKSRPVRRQFMGLNKKLDAEIARYYDYIFNGLPGVGNPFTRL